ncbi:unnamed protein product [Adineta ricciae]|uniref:Uncharacterized protein n=1 Tax=Adineta ricciae TaxID=249248 RepID=A0A815IG36_ADIRI|nr:unnamed protein product [Adineta ricciae]CAF1522330.1 unnamed protein product [Adineta ricciae]
MRWFLNNNETELDMVPDTRHKRSISSEHTITVDAIVGKDGSSFSLQHSLYYFCSTDKCNGPSSLKRLLQSLTLTDQFMELIDLLRPSTQFDGHWCLLLSNQTTEACKVPVVVDPNNCKQCSTTFISESKTIGSICAGCYTDDVHQEFLGREILFNLTDQTQTEIEMINCRSENCNSLRTIDLIRGKISKASTMTDQKRMTLVTGVYKSIGFKVVKKSLQQSSKTNEIILLGCRDIKRGQDISVKLVSRN